MRPRFKLAVAALLCVSLVQHGAAQKKQTEPALPQVRLSDVPEKAEIIGRLGVPIAEIVDVKGRWVKRTAKPDNAPWFTVTEVNGKAFDVPLLFRADSVKPVHSDVVKKIEPKEGDVWEMRGIEVCDYKGMPENVRKELGFPRFAQAAVGLVSRFEYVRARVVTGTADKARAGINERERAMHSVNSADIGDSVQLMGRLGAPLGKAVPIDGDVIVSEPKGDVMLAVDRINGVATNKAVYFAIERIKPISDKTRTVSLREGERWHFRAVEMGEFYGYADAVYDELGLRPPSGPHGFVTRLEYLSAELMNGGAK